jgi:Family of unknown function (DUF6064)
MLPFTREQFFGVFARYNVDVWPVQLFAYALGVAMIALLIRPTQGRARLIGAGLAVMWVWTGVAYHALYFVQINRVALLFGALFVLQGVGLCYVGVLRNGIAFGAATGAKAWVGAALIVYAAVVYPMIGLWSGHAFLELPMFGITPCPVTIFTFGVLLTSVSVPTGVVVIPLLWSVVGGSAAVLLGVPQDWVLLASGVGVVFWLFRRRALRRRQEAAATGNRPCARTDRPCARY